MRRHHSSKDIVDLIEFFSLISEGNETLQRRENSGINVDTLRNTVLSSSEEPPSSTPLHQITAFLHLWQDSLGDVVFAQLPEPGTTVEQKDECGALESVKAASELYSPVSGRIVEKNLAVEETPALINQSCYDRGWLFKIELGKPDELNNLMSEEEYEKFLKTDNH